MLEKIVRVLGSLRFWIVTLTAVIAVLTGVEKSGFSMVDLLNTIQVWLLAVAGIGTLDSIAEKLNKK
jgi:hypothetical protein